MNNHKKTITLGLAILVLALATVFLINRPYAEAPLKVPTKKQEVSLTPVTINQAAKTLLYLPLYIAQDQGFFKDEGIKATVVTGGGDSQAFAAVVGGSAQFGQGDPMMVPISRQRGGPGKIIGIVVDRVAFWGVAVNPKIPTINNPKDFRNKRVVTYPEPMTIYALQKRNVVLGGLTLGKNTNIIQAQFGTELGPLFARRADITMTIEPVVSQAIARGAHIVYSFPEKYGEFALTGVMVSDDLLREQPNLVQRVMNAYQRALTYAHQNPNDSKFTG